MKLEKMNEQQIRCTITNEDLKARSIKISELAYGTDKARLLFQDMMHKAADELDFRPGDDPIMIEAVPVSSECIVLTVTRVEDPDELDTRFARFAPELIEDKYDDDVSDVSMYSDISDDVLPWIRNQITSEAPAPKAEDLDLVRMFSFDSIGDLMSLAHVIAHDYDGVNSVYKDDKTGRYLLLLGQSGMDLMSFNRICNITSEYGESEKNLLAAQAYLDEHCDLIIGKKGIQQLSQI